MAVFRLNENLSVLIDDATELRLEGDYISAWNNKKMIAIFKASEVVGCWIECEKVMIDGKVY